MDDVKKFERENRYIVIKRSDLTKVPVAYRSHLVDPMLSLLSHLPHRECVVIEKATGMGFMNVTMALEELTKSRQRLEDAERRNESVDIEGAAQKLAACMDYPWEHMPEQGRASMREHAKSVIDAALNKPEEDKS